MVKTPHMVAVASKKMLGCFEVGQDLDEVSGRGSRGDTYLVSVRNLRCHQIQHSHAYNSSVHLLEPYVLRLQVFHTIEHKI